MADSGNKASQSSGPVDFVFYVDEKCEHVAEVLVHAWLDLHECSIEACLAGELLVGHASADHAAVPGRVHQEIEETKPVDLLQVGVSCLHSSVLDKPHYSTCWVVWLQPQRFSACSLSMLASNRTENELGYICLSATCLHVCAVSSYMLLVLHIMKQTFFVWVPDRPWGDWQQIKLVLDLFLYQAGRRHLLSSSNLLLCLQGGLPSRMNLQPSRQLLNLWQSGGSMLTSSQTRQCNRHWLRFWLTPCNTVALITALIQLGCQPPMTLGEQSCPPPSTRTA